MILDVKKVRQIKKYLVIPLIHHQAFNSPGLLAHIAFTYDLGDLSRDKGYCFHEIPPGRDQSAVQNWVSIAIQRLILHPVKISSLDH
jgi:hypothetical protein